MKADVLMYPSALTNQVLSEKRVVVIDALRATSTIVTALANRAVEVIPVNEPAEGIELARSIGTEECVIGGEQKGFKIEGFDLGNSPSEYLESRIARKKVILCTTNGTKAIRRAQGAAEVMIGSCLNLQTVVDELKSGDRDVLFICAGQYANLCLEDLACAGTAIRLLVSARNDVELTDAAMVAIFTAEHARNRGMGEFFKDTEHGRYLSQNGMEEDVRECSVLNRYHLLPRYVNGKIVIE